MKNFKQFKQEVKSRLKKEYKHVYEYKIAYEEYINNDCYFEISKNHTASGNPAVIW